MWSSPGVSWCPMTFRWEAKGSLFEFINKSLKHTEKPDNVELFLRKVKWISCNYWVTGKIQAVLGIHGGRGGEDEAPARPRNSTKYQILHWLSGWKAHSETRLTVWPVPAVQLHLGGIWCFRGLNCSKRSKGKIKSNSYKMWAMKCHCQKPKTKIHRITWRG